MPERKHLFNTSEKSDFILNMSAKDTQKLFGGYAIITMIFDMHKQNAIGILSFSLFKFPTKMPIKANIAVKQKTPEPENIIIYILKSNTCNV